MVGSRFETVQIYLMSKLSTSGHIASALCLYIHRVNGDFDTSDGDINEKIERSCKYMSYVVIKRRP